MQQTMERLQQCDSFDVAATPAKKINFSRDFPLGTTSNTLAVIYVYALARPEVSYLRHSILIVGFICVIRAVTARITFRPSSSLKHPNN